MTELTELLKTLESKLDPYIMALACSEANTVNPDICASYSHTTKKCIFAPKYMPNIPSQYDGIRRTYISQSQYDYIHNTPSTSQYNPSQYNYSSQYNPSQYNYSSQYNPSQYNYSSQYNPSAILSEEIDFPKSAQANDSSMYDDWNWLNDSLDDDRAQDISSYKHAYDTPPRSQGSSSFQEDLDGHTYSDEYIFDWNNLA